MKTGSCTAAQKTSWYILIHLGTWKILEDLWSWGQFLCDILICIKCITLRMIYLDILSSSSMIFYGHNWCNWWASLEKGGSYKASPRNVYSNSRLPPRTIDKRHLDTNGSLRQEQNTDGWLQAPSWRLQLSIFPLFGPPPWSLVQATFDAKGIQGRREW